MKHAFKTILLSTAVLALAACGSKPAPEENEPAAEEPAVVTEAPEQTAEPEPEKKSGSLLYIGHASLRITTPEDKVIYIDPYAPGDYSAPADLILVTHDHYDHNNVGLIENRAADCEVITQNEALADGKHQTFDLGYVTVEAVEAGNNPNHSITQCVGYVITLSDGYRIYISGDTSATEQMSAMEDMQIDLAFFCCDGQYNMGTEEAAQCAETVNAGVSIPYHTVVQEGVYFSRQQAETFDAPGRIILEPGESMELPSNGS